MKNQLSPVMKGDCYYLDVSEYVLILTMILNFFSIYNDSKKNTHCFLVLEESFK